MLLHQRLRVRSVLAHQRPAGDRRDDGVAAVAQVGVVVRLATARASVRVGVRCGCSFGEVLCVRLACVDGRHNHKAGRVAGRLAPGSGAARARPFYRACPSQRARRRQRGGSSIHAPAVPLALVRAARASLAPHRWSDWTSAGEEGPVATLRAPARRRSVPALLLRAAADASIFAVIARPDPPRRACDERQGLTSGQPPGSFR